jgi:hypothetical protein
MAKTVVAAARKLSEDNRIGIERWEGTKGKREEEALLVVLK